MKTYIYTEASMSVELGLDVVRDKLRGEGLMGVLPSLRSSTFYLFLYLTRKPYTLKTKSTLM